jgi:hypothetical protein
MRAGSGSSQAGRNRVRVPSAGSAAATHALRVGTPAAEAFTSTPLIAHALLDSWRQDAPGHEGGASREGPWRDLAREGGREGVWGEARREIRVLLSRLPVRRHRVSPGPLRVAAHRETRRPHTEPALPGRRRVECEYTQSPRVSVCRSVMMNGTSQAA